MFIIIESNPKVKNIKGFKIIFNIGFIVTLIIEISKTKRTSFGVLVVISIAGNKYLQAYTPRKLNIEIIMIFRSKLNIFCIFSILAKIWQKVKGFKHIPRLKNIATVLKMFLTSKVVQLLFVAFYVILSGIKCSQIST